MRPLFVPAVLTLFLSLGMIAFGQVPNRGPNRGAPTPQSDQDAQGQSDQVSLTGCLAKGPQANQYEITDRESHAKVAFPGPNQLDQYLNQIVRLTGKVVDDNGKKTFQPDSISRVSNSC
jgi:hypothetical protein